LVERSLNDFSFAFIFLANKVFRQIGLTNPVVVSASFYSIKKYKLWNNMWSKDHLEIDYLQFSSLSPVKSTTMECLNRIFQAFGYEASPDLPNNFLDT
jgi:hypothetical protein